MGAVRVPQQQHCTGALFKTLQGAAERRLGDFQATSTGRDTAGLNDGDERTQQGEIVEGAHTLRA